jgi:hypothetical protein
MRPVVRCMRYGYTWCNLHFILIWCITRNTHLRDVLWCNSCAILVSYECTRIVCPDTARQLRQRYRGLDTVAHYVPIVMLYNANPTPVHALVSMAVHLLWGYTHSFDLNVVYQVHVTPGQSYVLWACAIMGHLGSIVLGLSGEG